MDHMLTPSLKQPLKICESSISIKTLGEIKGIFLNRQLIKKKAGKEEKGNEEYMGLIENK